MKKSTLLSALSFLIIFSACKKDNSTATDPIAGTWNFISISANTRASSSYSILGSQLKDITTSSYTSTNGAGSVTFSGGNAVSKNIAYSVSTTAYDQSYQDNVLVDTFSMPFDFSIQPTSSTTTYKIIGTDSVSFPGGNIVSSQSLPNGAAQSVASGYRFSILSDTLTMTSIYSKDTVQNISGTIASVSEQVAYIVKLKKQ